MLRENNAVTDYEKPKAALTVVFGGAGGGAGMKMPFMSTSDSGVLVPYKRDPECVR